MDEQNFDSRQRVFRLVILNCRKHIPSFMPLKLLPIRILPNILSTDMSNGKNTSEELIEDSISYNIRHTFFRFISKDKFFLQNIWKLPTKIRCHISNHKIYFMTLSAPSQQYIKILRTLDVYSTGVQITPGTFIIFINIDRQLKYKLSARLH